MTRLLTLPITISLRIVALQLRLARGAAGFALDLTRDLAGGSPVDRGEETAPPAPATPASPPAADPDPAEGRGRARRSAAVQRPRARREPPAATTATDVPPPGAA